MLINKLKATVISLLLLAAPAFAQRTVMVSSNNSAILYPSNFFTANAASARSGLALQAFATNPVIPQTNGGTGATNAAVARTNFGLGWSALTNTDATNFRTAISLASYVTNPTIPLTNGGLGTTNIAVARTNLGLGWSALTNTSFGTATNTFCQGNDARIANIKAGSISNQDGIVELPDPNRSGGGGGTISMVGGNAYWGDGGNAGSISLDGGYLEGQGGSLISIGVDGFSGGTLNMSGGGSDDGGSISTYDGGGSINTRGTGTLELGVSGTRTTFVGAATSNITVSLPQSSVTLVGYSTNSALTAQSRTNLGLGATWLTNTDATNFRTAIGLASYVTNPTIPLTNGGLGTTNIAIARTNLGLGWSALTNTDATNFRTSIGLGSNNSPDFAAVNVLDPTLGGLTTIAGGSVGLYTSTNRSQGWSMVAAGISIGNVQILSGVGAYTSSITFTGNAASITRTNLGLGWSALTNTDGNTFLTAVGGLSVSNTSQAIVANTYQFQAATNDNPVNFSQMGLGSGSGGEYGGFYARNDGLYKFVFASGVATNALSDRVVFRTGGLELNVPLKFIGTNTTVNSAQSRTNLGLGWSALTNTDPANFRTAIGLASYVTNTIIPLTNGGLGTADIAVARTNLGLGWSALTNTDAINFRTAIGLGTTNSVTFSSLTLSSDLTFGDGDNIVLSTTNGTKIGTATNQLLGFYNQTPITRPSSTGVTTNGFTANGPANGVHADSRFTGGTGTNAYTISDIVAHLKSLGLIAP